MKYILFLLIFLALEGYGQAPTKPRDFDTKLAPYVKGKKSLTVLDKVHILTYLHWTSNEIMATKPGDKDSEIRIMLWKTGDTVFLKDSAALRPIAENFLNVLYPYALADSINLFKTLDISYCADSDYCAPIIFKLKKIGLSKLSTEEKLVNVLAILPFDLGYKIDTVENKKKRISLIINIDSSTYWRKYKSMSWFSQYLSFVIYDYVLPKKDKLKLYDGIRFIFTDPANNEIDRFGYFFNQELFRKMYSMPFFTKEKIIKL